MKTISINVSELTYEEFQLFGRKVNRKASELILEAMEQYRERHIQRRTSLRDRRPTSAGGPIQPIGAEDDIFGELISHREE